jgi:hypothetical protein
MDLQAMELMLRFSGSMSRQTARFNVKKMENNDNESIDCGECWRDRPRFSLDAIPQNRVPITLIALYSLRPWSDRFSCLHNGTVFEHQV